MALIQTIDHLREYVKINRSKDFTTYYPFVADAQDKYLEPYFGAELLADLEVNTLDRLNVLLCRALGPFSLALATAELSINFGEAGHTVSRSETVAPASDAKIEKAEASLFERGWRNLDMALNYLINNSEQYPLWNLSAMKHKYNTILFDGAVSFQDDGMIDIDYSPLTYYGLIPLIKRIEVTESITLVPSGVSISDHPHLASLLRGYTGSRVAALHTSRTTRIQRGKPKLGTEFRALIRPLFDNPEEDMNFYAQQAEAFAAQITAYLVDSNLEGYSSRWNEQDKRIFFANSRAND